LLKAPVHRPFPIAASADSAKPDHQMPRRFNREDYGEQKDQARTRRAHRLLSVKQRFLKMRMT
jgi:hypothetical protein